MLHYSELGFKMENLLPSHWKIFTASLPLLRLLVYGGE